MPEKHFPDILATLECHRLINDNDNWLQWPKNLGLPIKGSNTIYKVPNRETISFRVTYKGYGLLSLMTLDSPLIDFSLALKNRGEVQLIAAISPLSSISSKKTKAKKKRNCKARLPFPSKVIPENPRD